MSKRIMVMCLLLMLSGLCGCAPKEPSGDNVYQIYVVNKESTRIENHGHVMEATTQEEMLDELVECLSTQPAKLEYQVPFVMGFKLLSREVNGEKLTLNMDEAYHKLPATTEVLVRAAIVRTMTQLPNIKYVAFTVDGKELFDQTGEVVGLMSADTFINNDGNEINTYEPTRIKLYFANETGDKLISVYREEYYSTNIPLERFVIEELIGGPKSNAMGVYPSMNPQVKILSVMTKDGVCYVNLDSGFLTVINNVSTELSIYSVVNSLVELDSINKVQILINGEVPESFGSSVFERNLDCVTTLEKEQKEKEQKEKEQQESMSAEENASEKDGSKK